MPKCLYPRSRKRSGESELCQRAVPKEGERCPSHTPEAIRKAEEKKLERELAEKTDQQAGQITEIDASSMDELAKKLNPQLDMMRRLERILRDPDEGEGQDIYINIGRNNVIRLQMKVEADPNNMAAVIAVGNAIGQLKMNEKRHVEIQVRRLELAKLRREMQAVSASQADVLGMMMHTDLALASGFYKEDPSPRRSVDAYAEWLGEDITVEQVLAGEEEYATAPWEMQREILIALFWPDQAPVNKPDCNHIICVTGNNTGKSYISARCVLFNTYFLYPSITIVTGPRLSQVRDTVSAEVRRKHGEMGLPGKANVLRVQPNPEFDRAYVNFTSAQSDEAFAGHHGRILIIFEEASGVMPHIYESTLGLMSGSDCRMLEIGNMTRRQGNFYENYMRAEKNPDDPKTHMIQVGAHDHPNYKHRDFIRARGGKDIYKHALSAEWVDEMIDRWGEDHPRVRVRILGLPALQDTNYMIESHLVDSSMEYGYQGDNPDLTDEPVPFDIAAEVIFADIAGMGDNQTVIGNWQWGRHGHRIRIHHSFGHGNHSKIADKMFGLPTRQINDNVFFTCDTNGEGSGILDMLMERGVWEENTRGFKAHEGAEVEPSNKNQEQYADLETECWARLRNMLRQSYNSILRDIRVTAQQRSLRIDFPDEKDRYGEQVANELTMRSYFLDGKVIRLQPKKEYIKKTNGDSPDFAEAVVIGSRMVWVAQTELIAEDEEI